MTHSEIPADGTGNGTSESSNDELRDLAVLLALPAMWVGHDPAFIVNNLVGVLSSLLRLDSVYVRIDDVAGGPALEHWLPAGRDIPEVFLPIVLNATPTRDRGLVSILSDRTTHIGCMYPALPGEDGLILVGSSRSGFPSSTELHLLRVAVGQATISIRAARMLADERAARERAESALSMQSELISNLARALMPFINDLTIYARPENETPDALPIGTNPLKRGDGGAPETVNQPTHVPLTRREAEVLGLLAQGLSNKEIATELWLSDRTVERHITGLYAKIGVKRRTEATLFALRHGIGEADEDGT